MAAKKKAAKAGAAAMAAKNSPYVQRVLDDEDLRDNIVQAYESARSAYARLSSGKAPATKQIFDDKKLQKELQQAAWAFKDASVAFREAPKKQRSGGGIVRKLLLLVLVVGGAFAASEGLRKKALDALFGAEEEFEYTSSTTPETSPTANSGTVSGTGSSEPVGTA
jgi:hypothetical protein